MLTTWTLSSSHFKKIINCNDPLEVCKAGVASIGPWIPQPLHAVCVMLTWQFWAELSSTPEWEAAVQLPLLPFTSLLLAYKWDKPI